MIVTNGIEWNNRHLKVLGNNSLGLKNRKKMFGLKNRKNVTIMCFELIKLHYWIIKNLNESKSNCILHNS